MKLAPYRWLCLTLVAAALAVHFVHLLADIPLSRLNWETAVLSDEGWYSSGAINSVLWGHWLLPRDFNPVVAMPVWHCIAWLAFRLAGFGILTLRVTALLFFCVLVALAARIAWLLEGESAAWLTALLFSASSYAFVYSRTAFLEVPCLTFFAAAIVLIARRDRQTTTRYLLAGLLLSLALLSKLLILALFPAFIYLAWERADYRALAALGRLILCAVATAALPVAYYLLYVRHHLADFLYYFSSDKGTAPHFDLGLVAMFTRPVRKGYVIDPFLFYLLIAVIAAAVLAPALRGLWRRPLFTVGVLWLCFEMLYMVAHNYTPPRYYMVIVPSLFFLAASLVEYLRPLSASVSWRNSAFAALLLFVAADYAGNAIQTVYWATHPRYTIRDAMAGIRQQLLSDPSHSTVFTGHGAYFISLWMGGLKPINQEYGLDPLSVRAPQRDLGWFVAEDFDGRTGFADSQLQSRYNLVFIHEYPLLRYSPNGYGLYRVDPR